MFSVGYNRWRDALKPTQILAKLCKDSKIESSSYTNNTVRLNQKVFHIQTLDDNNRWYHAKGEQFFYSNEKIKIIRKISAP